MVLSKSPGNRNSENNGVTNLRQRVGRIAKRREKPWPFTLLHVDIEQRGRKEVAIMNSVETLFQNPTSSEMLISYNVRLHENVQGSQQQIQSFHIRMNESTGKREGFHRKVPTSMNEVDVGISVEGGKSWLSLVKNTSQA